MAGFDLKEGRYVKRDVTEDELWASLVRVFTTKSRNDVSYKYAFLKSLLDNLNNTDQRLTLTYDQLFKTFTEAYWSLILKYNLRQKAFAKDHRKAAIERVLLDALDKYGDGEYIPFDSLSTTAKVDIIHQVKMKCKTYVVGALFEDTNRLFYSFSKKGEWVQFNPQMYEFVCKRINDIKRLNNYEWAFFLEKVNEGISANDILAKYLLNDEDEFKKPCTMEPVFEIKSIEDERKRQGLDKYSFSELSCYDSAREIDEETRELLSDPEALIQLLKKRRGILR